MPLNLPARGQSDWDDENNANLQYVEGLANTAQTSATAANNAATAASDAASSASAAAAAAAADATEALATANTALAQSATDGTVSSFVSGGASTNAAVKAVVDSHPATWLYRTPERYGAGGAGATDDTTPLQDAINAASGDGAGIVYRRGPYRITGPVTVPPGVSLRGRNSRLTSLTTSTIKLDSGTACVIFGTGDARGGIHGGFNIDANNTGDTDGAMQVTAVQQEFSNITITNAVGVGLNVFASQNTIFRSVDVDSCDAVNVLIDGGSGGILFQRCEITVGTGGLGVKVTDGNPGGHPSYGYQFGPADIWFDKCIIETYVSSIVGLVLNEAGNRVKFSACGFSNNTATTVSQGYLIKLDNPVFTTTQTIAEFDSCNFHGGSVLLSPIFYIGASRAIVCHLIVRGNSFFQQSTAVFNTDGAGQITYQPSNDYVAGTVTTMFGALGGVNWINARPVQKTGQVIATPDATGAWSGHTPLAVRKDTDSASGSRLYVANDGTLGWCNGTNNVALVSATPDTTNKFVNFSGIKHSGRVVTSISSTSVTGAGTTVNTDCSTGGPHYGVLLSSAGTVTTWNLTNPVDGQEIQLWVHRAAAQTFVWPTNISWNGNAAPSTSPTAGTYTIVKLRYISATNKWYEISDRCVGVPA
jgi:hypothetical protein